jgi:hypothetical protein
MICLDIYLGLNDKRKFMIVIEESKDRFIPVLQFMFALLKDESSLLKIFVYYNLLELF